MHESLKKETNMIGYIIIIIIVFTFGSALYNFYWNIIKKNIVKNGEIKGYHSNGKLQFITNWNNGVQHGSVRSYDEQGNLIKKSNLVNGEYQGEQIEYYPSGAIKIKRIYKNDEIVEEQEYDLLGNLIEKLDNGPVTFENDSQNSSIKNLNKSVSEKDLLEDLYEESLVFGSTDYFKLNNKIIKQFKEALRSRKLEECFLVNVRSMAEMLKISGSTNVGNGFYDFIWGDVSHSKEDEELKNKIKQSYSDHYLLIEQLDLLKSKLTGKKHIERLKWDIEAAKARLLATATAAKVIGLTGKDLPVGGKLFDSFKF